MIPLPTLPSLMTPLPFSKFAHYCAFHSFKIPELSSESKFPSVFCFRSELVDPCFFFHNNNQRKHFGTLSLNLNINIYFEKNRQNQYMYIVQWCSSIKVGPKVPPKFLKKKLYPHQSAIKSLDSVFLCRFPATSLKLIHLVDRNADTLV